MIPTIIKNHILVNTDNQQFSCRRGSAERSLRWCLPVGLPAGRYLRYRVSVARHQSSSTGCLKQSRKLSPNSDMARGRTLVQTDRLVFAGSTTIWKARPRKVELNQGEVCLLRITATNLLRLLKSYARTLILLVSSVLPGESHRFSLISSTTYQKKNLRCIRLL